MPDTATSGMGQMARIVETVEFKDLLPNLPSQSVFSLSQFPRASTLAGSFQYYKAAKVTWNYEPLYNTFQDEAGGASVPYLYTYMNRGQLNIVNTLLQVQACGARPRKLVSRTQISYTPSWCSPGLTAFTGDATAITSVVSMGLKSQYDWLCTSGTEVRNVVPLPPPFPAGLITIPSIADPSPAIITPEELVAVPPITNAGSASNFTNSVLYNGHVNFIDQEVPGAEATPTCRLTATVVWLFKGALFNGVKTVVAPGT